MSIEKPDVFALMRRNRDGQEEVIILKSKARRHCVDIDEMSDEEFEEHWSYNIAGSLGLTEYCTVDDELDQEIIEEMMYEEGHGIIDPRGETSEFVDTRKEE
jgi:hypothetical protein